MTVAVLLPACLVITWAMAARAEVATGDVGSLVELKLTDDTRIVGEILEDTQDSVTVRTTAGVEITIARTAIASMRQARGSIRDGKYARRDPNYARLLFAPTGRPLKKGQGYFTDTYVVLPGVAYGFTDQISLLVGASVLPGVDFEDQVLYIVPKFGYEISDKAAVSIGGLYASFWDNVAAGILFATAAFGEHDRSVHAGVGFGFTKESERDYEFAKRPVFVFGANYRVSNGVAIVGESWPIPSIDVGQTIVPVGVAVRLFGDNMAVDLGIVIEKHVISEGYPIPWLSAAYNFGM